MRSRLAAVGIVVALLGVALLFAAVAPESEENVDSSAEAPYYTGSVDGFSLTGSIPVSVTWSVNGSFPVEVSAVACAPQSVCVPERAPIAHENGTAGSFSFAQPNGGAILLDVSYGAEPGEVVTFHLTVALATAGSVLAVAGLGILLVGVVARPRSGPPDASSAATPPTELPPTR